MSKKGFIKERLEKLEDINSYYKETQSTGGFRIGDFTDNLLPILKDLIEENIEIKNKLRELEDKIQPDIEKIGLND